MVPAEGRAGFIRVHLWLNTALSSPLLLRLATDLGLGLPLGAFLLVGSLLRLGRLAALAQRLEVARMLQTGYIYDDIVAKTGASTATISRVKRCLIYGADGYKIVLSRFGETEAQEKPERKDKTKAGK